MLSIFLPTGILLAAGLVTISSVAPALFPLQVLWILVGIAVIAFFYFFDWRLILNYRWLIGGIYLLSVLLLVLVLFFGPAIRGVRSWLEVGPLNFQPVELAKVALILLYASYFSRRHLSIARWGNIAGSFIFFAIPAALVAIQPDLGSALVLFGIWFSFLLLSGLPPRRLAVALLVFIVIGVLFWAYFLADYQKERVLGVFYPERNVLGINYSAVQSKIAIGSAGFWGKGYGQGTQAQLGFLTEPGTDFILPALMEEWGIFGGLVVILALMVLLIQILRVGASSERNFEKFICLGAASVFGLQFVLNAGSALGLTPVVGVTFPFVSYGGSSLIASFFLLAIVNAIAKAR
ncbi:MAG: FtsW/RodA/SpoVE family cell cycle protein [bacterium]